MRDRIGNGKWMNRQAERQGKKKMCVNESKERNGYAQRVLRVGIKKKRGRKRNFSLFFF